MNQSSDSHSEVPQSGIPSGDQRTQLRWLVDRIGCLSEAIGVEIESARPVEIEGMFWYYLEVTTKDMQRGAIVVVHADVGVPGHFTLGSLVTAASESDACFLVWVAPEFHPSHVKALEWLDSVTSASVRVFGVQVSSESGFSLFGKHTPTSKDE